MKTRSMRGTEDVDYGVDRATRAQLKVAKSFILRAFIPSHVNRSSASKLLDELEGTVWSSDQDVLLRALSCNLNPQRFVGTHLIKNVTFLLQAFQNVRSARHAEELWELLDQATQRNSRVGFAALARGLPFSKLPVTMKKNTPCLLEGLKKNRFPWRHLPVVYKRDLKFALAARSNGATEFRRVLHMVIDKDTLWLEWACKHPERTEPKDWTERAVPTSIKADPDLMYEVLKVHPSVARILDPSLAGNKEYVTSLLVNSPETLAYFPKQTYDQYPEVVSVPAIKRYTKAGGDVFELGDLVPSQFWADRDFVLGWVSAGGDLRYTRNLSAAISGDQEVFLALAKAIPIEGDIYYREESFELMSPSLKKDKEFVMKLCESTDSAYFLDCIDRSLQTDEDILMAACATLTSAEGVLDDYDRAYYRVYGESFSDRVVRKMRAFEGFFKGILCGMVAESGSALELLDQGPDSGIKRNIASYLDFPKGKQLQHLLRAARNLKHVEGFHPYESEYM